MNHLHRWPLLATFVATTAIFVACAGGSPIDVGDDDDDAATTPAAVDVTFATGVVPALASEGCGASGCHLAPAAGAGNLALSGTVAEIYTEITTSMVINTANAASSLILTKGAGTAHSGGALWATTDNSYQSVLGWIQAGALNN